MENNEIKFTGPRDLTNYLNGAQDLINDIPPLSAIIKTSNLISVGCACKKKQKKNTANETYCNVLNNYLTKEDQGRIKEKLKNPTKIIFNFYNENTQRDETTLTIE
jgi:hypothetical protein